MPFEVGGNLLNKMWIPNDIILAEINDYLENIFKENFMIGIQLRYSSKYIDEEKDTEKFMKCSQQITRDVQQLTKNFSEKYKDVKWFVTSDRGDILNRLKKRYADKIVLGEGRLGHVGRKLYAYKRTILDLELLAKCNELIITGGSTFGFVAAMKALKLPYFVETKLDGCVRKGLGRPPQQHLGYGSF